MPIASYTIKLDQYADYVPPTVFPYLQSDGETPEDLTGYSAMLEIRKYATDLSATISITDTVSSWGVVTLGGALGTVQISITRAATSILTQGIYKYTLVLIAPSGLVVPFLGGDVNVAPGYVFGSPPSPPPAPPPPSAGANLISVTTVVVLATLATSTLASGSEAYVQSLKSTFYLDPTSTATADNETVIGAQGGGNWVRLNLKQQPPADIYLDPVHGDDGNPGTSLLPVQTFNGGILDRYGDDFAGATTVHLVSSQTPGSERIIFNPKLRGANTNLVIDGSSGIVWGSTFAAGTVTPFAWGNPGVDLQIASMPGGTVAGQIALNVTRQSYAVIDSMSGSTATLCTPITVASYATGPLVDTGWTTGDTIQVGTLPYLNLEYLTLTSGDTNASFTSGNFALQFVRVPDVSGVSGSSQATLIFHSGSNVRINFCALDSYAFVDGSDAFSVQATGCWFGGGAQFVGTFTSVYGGSSNASGNESTWLQGGQYFYGLILHGQVTTLSGFGPVTLLGVHAKAISSLRFQVSSDTTLRLSQSVTTPVASPIGAGSLWGATDLLVQVGARVVIATSNATTWASNPQQSRLLGRRLHDGRRVHLRDWHMALADPADAREPRPVGVALRWQPDHDGQRLQRRRVHR